LAYPTEKTHIEQDCRELTGHHKDALFFGCEFDKVAGLVLENCDLNKSRFLTTEIKDALKFTLTLNCHSFKGVEYSPLLFDLLVVLMLMSRGNDEKRQRLVQVIGRERIVEILRQIKYLE
jgi:hypothetical protein